MIAGLFAQFFGPRLPGSGIKTGQRYSASAVFEGGETSLPVELSAAGKVPLGAVLQASIEFGTIGQVKSVVCQRNPDGKFVVVLYTPDGASAGTIPVNGLVQY